MITHKFSSFLPVETSIVVFGWRTLAARVTSLDSTFISLQGYRNTNTIERVSQSSIASRYSTIKRTFTRSCVLRIVSPSYNLRCMLGDINKVFVLEPALSFFFFKIEINFTRFEENDSEIRRRQCGIPSKVKKKKKKASFFLFRLEI